jgi:hypothetical protein
MGRAVFWRSIELQGRSDPTRLARDSFRSLKRIQNWKSSPVWREHNRGAACEGVIKELDARVVNLCSVQNVRRLLGEMSRR